MEYHLDSQMGKVSGIWWVQARAQLLKLLMALMLENVLELWRVESWDSKSVAWTERTRETSLESVAMDTLAILSQAR